MTYDYAAIKKLLEDGEIDRLSRMGTDAAFQLVKFLDETPEHMFLERASEALVKMGTPAIPVVMREITNEHAQNVLFRIGSPTLPALIETLKGNKMEIQLAAARVIGLIGVGKTHFDEILKMLESKTKRGRFGAIYALHEIDRGNPEHDWSAAVRLSLPALGDKNKDMQMAAIELLVKIGEPAVPALIDALKHADGTVRQSAAKGLARIAETTEIDLRAVERAFKEHIDSVREGWGEAETSRAKRILTRRYIQIARAAAKFRELHAGMEGVILEGERPKPPSQERGMYRKGRRAMA